MTIKMLLIKDVKEGMILGKDIFSLVMFYY